LVYIINSENPELRIKYQMEKYSYSNYKAEELVNDQFFLESMKNPSRESELYWQELVTKGIVSKVEFDLAKSFVTSLKVKSSKMSQDELTELWVNIEITNKKQLKRKLKRLFTISSAACIALFITLSVSYYWVENHPEQSIASIASALKPLKNPTDVQLILGNNKNIAITDKDANIEYGDKGDIKVNTQTVSSNNNQTADESATVNDEYNQLIVPMGKRSTLTFSDGTKLWVNAGTRIVYPVEFKKEKREIYVDGEIFLNVEPDKNRPFIVKTKKMDIRVLGTSFNVTAYEDDAVHSIVLVTGAVNVKTDTKKEVDMVPNNRVTFSGKELDVKMVDASLYTSWKDGLYLYNSEKLGTILDRLSRYYGKEIIYDSNVASLKCSGKLDLKDNIIDVLTGLCQTAPIDFKHKGERIEFCLTNKPILPM